MLNKMADDLWGEIVKIMNRQNGTIYEVAEGIVTEINAVKQDQKLQLVDLERKLLDLETKADAQNRLIGQVLQNLLQLQSSLSATVGGAGAGGNTGGSPDGGNSGGSAGTPLVSSADVLKVHICFSNYYWFRLVRIQSYFLDPILLFSKIWKYALQIATPERNGLFLKFNRPI